MTPQIFCGQPQSGIFIITINSSKCIHKQHHGQDGSKPHAKNLPNYFECLILSGIQKKINEIIKNLIKKNIQGNRISI